MIPRSLFTRRIDELTALTVVLMLEEIQSAWAILDGQKLWIKALTGFGGSLLLAFLVRYLAVGPLKFVIGKSENEYDDKLFKLATPLINAGVFITGLWATLLWVWGGDSTGKAVAATVLMCVLLFLVGRFLSKSVDEFFPHAIEGMKARMGVDVANIQTLITAVLKIAIWGSAAMVILDQLNVNVTAFIASATILSLVIGMALQETAGSMVSGMMMMADKPFQKGDKITVMGIRGTVVDIGMMSTKLRTGEEYMVIIPNKTISGEVVTNFALGGPVTSPGRVNLRMIFGVDYSEVPSHVKRVLIEIAEDCDYIAKEPAPTVLFLEMLDSAITFRLNCFIKDYRDEWVARDWINTHVLERFAEEDIGIPYPHMQLKYEPQAIAEERARLEKAQTEARAADKATKQAEAKAERQEQEKRLFADRKKLHTQVEKLRKQLADPDIEDETMKELSAKIRKLEDKLEAGDADADVDD
jgi:small-conductance mechanosensitive channel